MAISLASLSLVSATLSQKIDVPCSTELPRAIPLTCHNSVTCTTETTFNGESNCKRRLLVLGVGALTTSLLPVNPLLAEVDVMSLMLMSSPRITGNGSQLNETFPMFWQCAEVPKNYESFVDLQDGYSYFYPSDWIDFDFRAHDSAFKDRTRQLQNVRVRFIPTDKKDIHDLGPMEQVISDLVKHVYAAPNQRPIIMSMQERSIDGKNYYTFEYELTSPNYSSVSFATIGICNGRYYTLIVAANERRWKRFRNQLKVVADSFRMFDI